jgi:serine/threonine-protein kinase RsbW
MDTPPTRFVLAEWLSAASSSMGEAMASLALQRAFQLPLDGEGPVLLDLEGLDSDPNELLGMIIHIALSAHSDDRPVELDHAPSSLQQRLDDLGVDDLFVLEESVSSRDLEKPDAIQDFPSGLRNGLPLVLPPELSSTVIVRDAATLLAREMGFDTMTSGDIALCVGEAAVNAVRHGSPNGDCDRLTARFFQGKHALVVELSDNGTGFEPSAVRRPIAEQMKENGLGLFLMRSLMDFVAFLYANGTTVQLIKKLGSHPAPIVGGSGEAGAFLYNPAAHYHSTFNAGGFETVFRSPNLD